MAEHFKNGTNRLTGRNDINKFDATYGISGFCELIRNGMPLDSNNTGRDI